MDVFFSSQSVGRNVCKLSFFGSLSSKKADRFLFQINLKLILKILVPSYHVLRRFLLLFFIVIDFCQLFLQFLTPLLLILLIQRKLYYAHFLKTEFKNLIFFYLKGLSLALSFVCISVAVFRIWKNGID